MPRDNVAALRAWVDDMGGTRAAARILELSESFLSNILHRRRKPGRVNALRISIIVPGTPVAGWDA